MSETNAIQAALYNLPPEMVFKRVKGSGRPMAQIIPEIVSIISKWQSVEPLCKLLAPRKRKETEIELTEEALSQHIDWLNQKASESISKAFGLFGGTGENKVHLGIALGYYSNLEKLNITLSSQFMKRDSKMDSLLDAISQIGQCFDAFTGYTYEHHVGVFNAPHNFPLSQFDSSKVPYGIWWVNYWSQQQVDTIGRERVMNAPWLKAFNSSNSAIVMAMTSERPDFTNSKHVQRFERVTHALNLQAFQETSAPSEEFSFDSLG